MKVLHLIDTGGPGGAETVYLRLVEGMNARGWQGVAAVPVVDWLHNALLQRGTVPTLVPHGGSVDFTYLRRLLRLVRREEISLVHAHLLGSSVYASLVASIHDLPVVCTFHGLPDIPRQGRFLSAKLRLIQRPANRLVFVSRGLEGALRARHGLHPKWCRVIYNGTPFPTPRLLGDERREAGAGSGDFLAVAVGNVRHAKDYGTLLDCTALARARGVPIKLAILGQGGGALLESLLLKRSALGLEGTVKFMGFRPDAARFLAAADVFVSSSSSEGFSLSTVEALGLARPVVVTRSGGPEEIVVDGMSGWLVPTRDPRALADAIGSAYADPAEARRRGAVGEAQVRERFAMVRMLDEYEALYGEVLSERSSSQRLPPPAELAEERP